jgi:hypothetical protein
MAFAAPFSPPPASHTPSAAYQCRLSSFCRRSPLLYECAILAPRSRPFHLTGFTSELGRLSGLGPQGSEATYRRICCLLLLHLLDTLPADICDFRTDHAHGPCRVCCARRSLSNLFLARLSRQRSPTAVESASARTRARKQPVLLSHHLLRHTYKHTDLQSAHNSSSSCSGKWRKRCFRIADRQSVSIRNSDPL